MTTVLLSIYAASESSERTERYHVLMAYRKLKRTFRDKLQSTWQSDLHDATFQVIGWPDYEAELVEFSKQLPCARLFIQKIDLLEICNGQKI